MNNEKSFSKQNFKSEEPGRDVYTTSQMRERALNAAIVGADVGYGYEEYLTIFDAFYDDEIEVSSETAEEPIRGKDRVRSLLGNFLYPVHVMSEVGGLTVKIRVNEIAGDIAGETHSAWAAEFVGVSGRTSTVSWRVLRKWNGSRVVYEYHYDQQPKGRGFDGRRFEFQCLNVRAAVWQAVLKSQCDLREWSAGANES